MYRCLKIRGILKADSVRGGGRVNTCDKDRRRWGWVS